jgi:hypothetical protein
MGIRSRVANQRLRLETTRAFPFEAEASRKHDRRINSYEQGSSAVCHAIVSRGCSEERPFGQDGRWLEQESHYARPHRCLVLYRSVCGARLYSSLNERTKTFRTPFRDPPLGLSRQPSPDHRMMQHACGSQCADQWRRCYQPHRRALETLGRLQSIDIRGHVRDPLSIRRRPRAGAQPPVLVDPGDGINGKHRYLAAEPRTLAPPTYRKPIQFD